MAVAVQVAVNNATFHFDKLYSYLVPEQLQDNVFIGSMVLVPFGNTKMPRMAVVLKTQLIEGDRKLKSIIDVAPEKAMLTGELLDLVYYLKEQTFCTFYDAVKAIIPYGAQYKAINTENGFALQKQLRRHTQALYIAANYDGKLTAKQMLALKIAKTETSKQTFVNAGISAAVLKTLCDKGALVKTETDKEISIYDTNILPKDDIILSQDQQEVFENLNKMLVQNKPSTALLHGVTSSGKTLVFIQLIKSAIKQNKQALVLVPEISLTPQMIYRLKSHFGNRVSVQHSALSNTERLLEWHQIQLDKADIVVGTRSAVFAPLSRLGLIIIDEEQEHTYRSEQAPRFDARDIAKKRCLSNNALLLLASATPSTESYYNAVSGKNKLLKLIKRYNDMPLPKVELVDMRKELLDGNASSISRELVQEISKNIQNKKQTILLLNRRGYKTVGMCTSCCEVIKCPSCSVPMVYHKKDNKLLCHYCGKYISPVLEKCQNCKGNIKYTGFGTQRVEEELENIFPNARILRMDMDSTIRKNSHEVLLRAFAKGEYDIMIGTQMVAKGLDFSEVTLVGVLGVDQLLFSQGYKAFESVFSLITQVVGRGGRASEEGRAIIQTVDTLHPVLNLAASQNYEDFFNQEIAFRKLNLYPPFCTICMVGFTGNKEDAVFEASKKFAEIVAEKAKKADKVPLRILGPAPMSVSMVNNKYRYKLTIKCRNDNKFKTLMCDALLEYNNEGLISKANVYLDFNSDADI